jgi:hypothetical protein
MLITGINGIITRVDRTIAEPTMTYSVQSTPHLVLQTQNSPVSIHSGNGKSVVIKATTHMGLFTSDTTTKNVITYQHDNTINVKTLEKTLFSLFGNGDAYVALDITVPSNSDVQIVGSGDIVINAVNGQVAANIGDGNIEVEHVNGSINLHTHAGNITANDASGQIALDTTHGDIKATDTHLTANSNINTMAGNVTFNGTLDPHGSYTIHSNAGNVNVTLPADGTVAVQASVTQGNLTNAFDHADTNGDASSRVHISSDAGNVTVSKQ